MFIREEFRRLLCCFLLGTSFLQFAFEETEGRSQEQMSWVSSRREKERDGWCWLGDPLFEIFNERLLSPEILTFSYIARGNRPEQRLFPHSNRKQKAVRIKLSSVILFISMNVYNVFIVNPAY